ncbi:MAG: hypothetical protein HRF45_06395 [Fimbriimonadia bacterium]
MTINPVDLLSSAEEVLRDLDERIARAEEERKAKAFLDGLLARRERAEALGLDDIIAEIDERCRAVEAFLAGTTAPAPVAEAPPPAEPAAPGVALVEMEPEAEAAVKEAVAVPPVTEVAPDVEEVAAYRQALDATIAEIEVVAKPTEWDGRAMAALKAVAARLRAVEAWGRELGQNGLEVGKAVKRVRDLFNRHYRGKYHTHGFPMHETRTATRGRWEMLANAYSLLAKAEQAYWLALYDQQDLTEQERNDTLTAIAATEAHVYRVLRDEFDGAADQQQHDFHQMLEPITEERQWFVPVWNQNMSNSEVARLAAALPEHLQSRAKLLQARRLRAPALKALTDLITETPVPEDFEERLCQVVAECLKAGVKVSDKEMRTHLLPYCAILEEAEDEGVRRVAAEVAKELSRLERKRIPEPPEPEQPDAEHDARLAEVVEHTRGKVMLFMGGKRQEERRRQLETLLELKELMWPDFEHDSKPAEFMDEALKADILCYLIRWSRKNVKEVARVCKEKGGKVVRLPAGVGIHRVVQDLHEQLVANRRDG